MKSMIDSLGTPGLASKQAHQYDSSNAGHRLAA
jgi:hypothetical protein